VFNYQDLNPPLENLFGLSDEVLAFGITSIDILFDFFVPVSSYIILGKGDTL
jgi:hypothetical protein